MSPVTDESSIKLHTDADGNVWHSTGIGPPINSGQTAPVFLLSSVVSGFGRCIRVLGAAQNAELISSLYLRRRAREVVALEIAGPNVCETPLELSDPTLVLYRMRMVRLPSSCGGWHSATGADYVTYSMIAHMQRNADAYDTTVQKLLSIHAAYKALSFIPTLDAAAVARLLKLVIDPRWFTDRRAPNRAGKLELFFGLTPRSQKRVSNPERLLYRPRELRCSLVMDCWKTAHSGAIDLTQPNNFLYRVHAACGGGTRGDLRASQAFLRYLRHTWLDALENRTGARDGLFAPELFFKTPGEQAAYTAHVSQV